MDTSTLQLKDLQDQVAKLSSSLNDLSAAYYKNNFSDHQDFNKYCSFNTTLKVPSYSSLPTTNNVGEIIESGGVLYISTAVNTWTIVGSQ